jgi:hypothetical protein
MTGRRKTSKRETEGAKYTDDNHHKQDKKEEDFVTSKKTWQRDSNGKLRTGWLCKGKRLTNLTLKDGRYVNKTK